MPIRVVCGSCNAKVNAPDRLAGKKVKCTACKAAIAVPAPVNSPDDAVEAPAPSAEKRPGKSKTTADLPLLSYDELNIPPRIRRRIENAVGEEKILWIGRQDPKALMRKAWLGTLAGIGMVLFGVALLVVVFILANKVSAQEADKKPEPPDVKEVAKETKDPDDKAAVKAKTGKKGKAKTPEEIEAARQKAAEKAAAKEAARQKAAETAAIREAARAREAANTQLSVYLCGGGFVVLTWMMAFPFVFLPVFTRIFMHNRNCYIITNRRALVVGYIRRRDYSPDDLEDREVTIRANGVGNIVMGRDISTAHAGTRREEHRKEKIGFMDVADAAKVEDFLRRALRLPAPKTYKKA